MNPYSGQYDYGFQQSLRGPLLTPRYVVPLSASVVVGGAVPVVVVPAKSGFNWFWILVIVALILLLIWWMRRSNAQDILVNVKPKTSQHPWFNQGSPNGFTVNGVEGGTLNLKRGKTYRFVYQAPVTNTINDHLFYFTNSDTGGPGDNGMISGSPAPFLKTTTVKIDSKYPDTFYYQCANHPRMGGRVVVTA